MLQAMRRMSLLFRFCDQTKYHSLRLTRELLAQYKQFQPWKNIRTLYSLTAAHKQLAPPSSQLQEDRILISQVLEDLGSQIHLVRHQQLNILMETLRDNGIRYNRDSAIFRALNKQAKLLFGRNFQVDLLPRSLQWLNALDFPKLTINKILDSSVKAATEMTKDKSDKKGMSLSTKLQLTIFSMEQPFVTIPMVISWLKVVLPETAKSLGSLCQLYYLVKLADSCLARKIEYQYQKTSARELLFNPYGELELAESNQPEQAEGITQVSDQESKIEIKKRLNEMGEQVIKMISQAVDIDSLKKSIVTAVKEDSQPLKKDQMLYVCDIQELQDVVQQYVRKNLQSLSPVELMYILRRCSKETVDEAFESYMTQLGVHMNLQEKAYMYLSGHKLFHRPVTKEAIFEMLEGIKNISYAEFIAVSRLAQLLPQSQHIGEVIKRIKQKLPAEKTRAN